MKADEIFDIKSTQTWLATRPTTTRATEIVTLTKRIALRAFPVWSQRVEHLPFDEDLVTVLTILRCHLTASAAQFDPSRTLISATAVAGNAADALSDIVADAAAYFSGAVTSDVEDDRYSSLVATAKATSEAAAQLAIPEYIEYNLWTNVRIDAGLIERGVGVGGTSIWPGSIPPWFATADTRTREIWSRDPETWDFWLRWWDGVLSGNQLDWELQKAVALEIPEEAWSDPKTVAAHIRDIEARFRQPKEGDWLEAAVANQPRPAKTQVKLTQAAMERNREALPPTFEAIEGLLLLEIERLQLLNYVDEAILRQLGIYLQLYEAVRALRVQLPEQGPVPEKAAEKSIGLLRLYTAKFSELPRAKVDDVVEGVYETGKGVVKLGLIGLSTALGVSYGLPALGCLAVGSMVFAPKSATELIKAAKEVIAATPKS